MPSTESLPLCRRCGQPMRPGLAIEQTWSAGVPDFPGDNRVQTFYPSGPGHLIECLKCTGCGHSLTAAPTLENVMRVITLTGPSCAGKSTLAQRLTETGEFAEAVSCTTRPPRAGEVEGQHYYFLNHEQMDGLIAAGALLEYILFNGSRYGVAAQEFERIAATGKIPVVVVEPHGAEQVAKACAERGWQCHSIFVDTPLQRRINRLLRRYSADMAAASQKSVEKVDVMNPAIAAGEVETLIGNLRKLADSYTSRLKAMVEVEEGWLNAFTLAMTEYTLIPEFGAENEAEMVELVRRLVRKGGAACTK